METQIVPLKATRGADFLRGFKLQGNWLGNDIAKAEFTVRRRVPMTMAELPSDGDGEVLVKVTLDTTTPGSIWFEDNSNQGYVRINRAITTTFEHDTEFVYDLTLLTNSDIEHVPVKGPITFGWDATRASLTL